MLERVKQHLGGGPSDMVASLRPIKAWTSEGALRLHWQVDPERLQPGPSWRSETEVRLKETSRAHAVGERNSEFAREMAVAGTSFSDGEVTVLGIERLFGRPDTAGKRCQGLDQCCSLCASEPNVTVPPLSHVFDEPTVEQLVRMLAR